MNSVIQFGTVIFKKTIHISILDGTKDFMVDQRIAIFLL